MIFGEGIISMNDFLCQSDPQKALRWVKLRCLTYRAWKSVERFGLWTRRKKSKKNINKEATEVDISHLCRANPSRRILTKFGAFGDLASIINSEKNPCSAGIVKITSVCDDGYMKQTFSSHYKQQSTTINEYFSPVRSNSRPYKRTQDYFTIFKGKANKL